MISSGKTILISGVTSGMGREMMAGLLGEGYKVAGFAPSAEKCRVMAKELSALFDSRNFLVVVGDVRKEMGLKKVITASIKKFKKIDILINNAGYGFFTESDKINIKEYQEMIDVNLVGIARLTKIVVPYMKKQKSGQIINIVSVAGRKTGAKGEFYASTKFGVMGFSEGIRQELKPFRIKVATVCPGTTQTNFFTRAEMERRKKELGLKQDPPMLTTHDVARTVSLICNQPATSDIQDILVLPL